MRKLKLEAEALMVETFEPVADRDDENGTVHALEAFQETNDPRQRLCVTPYIECSTQGWTCVYCGGTVSALC